MEKESTHNRRLSEGEEEAASAGSPGLLRRLLRRPLLQVLLAVLLLASLQVLFTGCNLLAQTLPKDVIEQHIDKSQDSPLFTRTYRYDYQLFGSRVNYDNNRFLVSIALQQEHDSAFETYVRASIVDSSPDPEEESARKYSSYDYFRYWHGWQLLSNLCFSLGPVGLLQAVVACLALLATALLFMGLKKYVGMGGALAFTALAFLSTNILGNFLGDITLTISIFTVTYFCAAILFVGKSGLPQKNFLVSLLCLAAGAFYNFTDFLTIPAFAITLTVFCALLATNAQEKGMKSFLFSLLLFTFAFFVGYVFTWITKWAQMGALIGFSEVFANVRNETLFWGLGDVRVPGGNWDPVYEFSQQLCALGLNLYTVFYGNQPAGIIGAVAIVAIVVVFVVNRAKARKTSSQKVKTGASLLLIPALFVPLYYVIMSAHSIWHVDVFAYKNWAIVAAIVAIVPLMALRNTPRATELASVEPKQQDPKDS
jgi:hypothetical protein